MNNLQDHGSLAVLLNVTEMHWDVGLTILDGADVDGQSKI